MTERRALALAAAAHLALLAALSLAIRLAPPPSTASDVTPVEFVDIGAETTTPSPASQPASPLAAPEPLPEPMPEPAEAAPEPLPVAPAPPSPAPRDLAVQEAVPGEPPPAARASPRPAPASPPAPFDPSALAALIDRSATRAPRRPPPGSEAGARGSAPGSPGPQALATLEAAIRAQIAPCWNPPVGGQDVQAMTVVLRIRLNRDGSLAGPPEFVSQTGATDANAAYARAFVETAKRAVLRCSPLELPADLYHQWREFELNFDPRMLT